jgi:hypothetical protein
MERAGVPTISLRVGVPHYLTHLEHPLAVAALVQHLAHVLGLPLTVDVQQAADRWRLQHDELVADDEQLRAYVRMLEIEYDRPAEATLRRADDIGDQFEAFLREQRDERGPDEPVGLTVSRRRWSPSCRRRWRSPARTSPPCRRCR